MKVYCAITELQRTQLEDHLSAKRQLHLENVVFYDNPGQAAFAAYRQIGKDLKLNFSNNNVASRTPKYLRSSKGDVFNKAVCILEDKLPAESLLWSSEWQVHAVSPNRIYIRKNLIVDAASTCSIHELKPCSSQMQVRSFALKKLLCGVASCTPCSILFFPMAKKHS